MYYLNKCRNIRYILLSRLDEIHRPMNTLPEVGHEDCVKARRQKTKDVLRHFAAILDTSCQTELSNGIETS